MKNRARQIYPTYSRAREEDLNLFIQIIYIFKKLHLKTKTANNILNFANYNSLEATIVVVRSRNRQR